MQEFELQHIWDNENEAANTHYSTISGKVERLARQKSNNILYKIQRNSKMEIYATIFLSVLFFTILDGIVIKSILLIAGVPSIWFAADLYQKLRTNIREAFQAQTVEAIQEYISILGRYVKRLKIYSDIGIPIAFALGIIGSMLNVPDPGTITDFITRFLSTFLLSSPLLILIVWISKKYYIQWLYGKHKDSLQDLLDHLRVSEGIHE